MGIRIGIGKKLIAAAIITGDDDMKYPQATVNLIEGDNTLITTLTTIPYSVQLVDSDGNIISDRVDISIGFVAGVYEIYISTGVALNGVGVYILY